jgi:hypothetical protein
MRTVLTATIRFSIEFFSRSSFVVPGARAEVRCATDKISVGNGQIFMSKGLLETGEKGLPEYVSNSFLDPPSWGRILFVPVINCSGNHMTSYEHLKKSKSAPLGPLLEIKSIKYPRASTL